MFAASPCSQYLSGRGHRSPNCPHCVEERLAACGNLIPGVESIYRWKGKIETATEILVVFKMTSESYPKLEARIVELHPYEVPEVVAIPPSGGLPLYMEWIVNETGEPDRSLS